jgi:hypothetical protein
MLKEETRHIDCNEEEDFAAELMQQSTRKEL